MGVRFERYSDLEPLTKTAIPRPPPLYVPGDKKARRKVLAFLTYWQHLHVYGQEHIEPGCSGMTYLDFIRKRLPVECRRTCMARDKNGNELTCFIIATNATERELEKGQDLELINLVRDAIGWDCGSPLWLRPR